MKLVILFFTLLSVTAQNTMPDRDDANVVEQQSSPHDYHSDSRTQALKKVLKRYNSPLTDKAAHFVEYADKCEVDWKLLPAISGIESSFGKRLVPGSYNAYGWGGGYIYFSDWEDGMETVNCALKEKYIDRGADTVDKIGPIYAEAKHWSARVSYFIEEIDREYQLITSS